MDCINVDKLTIFTIFFFFDDTETIIVIIDFRNTSFTLTKKYLVKLLSILFYDRLEEGKKADPFLGLILLHSEDRGIIKTV